MTPDAWYLVREGTEYGPYTREQLRTFVAEGRIARTDLLRQDGQSDWRIATEIPGLFGPVPGPPPMPDEVAPAYAHISPEAAGLVQSPSPTPADASASSSDPGLSAAAKMAEQCTPAVKRRRRWVIPVAITATLFAAIAGGYWLTRPEPDPCSGYHFEITEDTASLAFGASDDQQEVLAVNGPPEAYTVYWDRLSGAEIEEWSYYTLGQELVFVDGTYQGGVEVPAPEVVDTAAIPRTRIYPWEVRGAPRASCIVRLAGPALFRTSALVLPGWNDEYQVARLWTLAAGGSMITVDGRLAMVSIDPGEPVELASLELRELLIGTLGEGEWRLGALLTPGELPGTYRLSLSPRGQGTTADGTEYVLDLTASKLHGTYTLGENARLSVVALDSAESPVQATGNVTIKRRGDAYLVRLDVWLENPTRQVSGEGLLATGLWRAGDDALAQVLDEASEPVGYSSKPLQLPAMTPLPEGELTVAVPTGSLAATSEGQSLVENDTFLVEADSEWKLWLYDAFDDNKNYWPLNQDEYEFVNLQARLDDGRYVMDISKTKGTRPWIVQRMDFYLNHDFVVSVDSEQLRGRDAECGLYLHVMGKGASVQLQVSSTEGRFRWVFIEDSVLRHLAEWTESPAIRPDEKNRISMVASDDTLVAFINGQQVAQSERTFGAIDRVGLVGSLGSDEPLTCSFDNLVVRVP